MKSSSYCFVVLVCFALAGLSCAQTTVNQNMSMEEIARRLIRKRVEWPYKYPSRVTITSVQVTSQGGDKYDVEAKYTTRSYYTERTHVQDYDHHFLLLNEGGRWKLQSVSSTHDAGRSDAKATPPPAGETDVPAPPSDVAPAPAPVAAITPAPAVTGNLKYAVGQRVDYHYDGKWFKAIITKTRDNDRYQFRVHPIGYEDTMDTWVPGDETWIRPSGSGPTEPVPGGEANDPTLKAMGGVKMVIPNQSISAGAITAKEYHCVMFAGNQLVDTAPLTITGGSSYTDSDGARGTYSLNSSTLTFHGGNYDGQRATYDNKGGLPQIHILGPTGRPVIDCD